MHHWAHAHLPTGGHASVNEARCWPELGPGPGVPTTQPRGGRVAGSAWLQDGAPQAHLAWTGSQDNETEAELESHRSISLDMA